MVTMLVTRPQPDASETARRLNALDIDTVLDPLLTAQTLPTGLPAPAGFAAVAVTSANALRALEDRGALDAYRTLPLYAVGDRTADVARRLGFRTVSSAGGNLSDLLSMLVRAELTGPVFYPAARHQSGDLAKALAPHGIMAITTPLYDMRPAIALADATREGLGSGRIAAALFYSRRTAETFAHLAGTLGDRTRFGVLCLSEAVAAPLVAAHFVRVGLADHPSEEAMMGLALSFAREQNPA